MSYLIFWPAQQLLFSFSTSRIIWSGTGRSKMIQSSPPQGRETIVLNTTGEALVRFTSITWQSRLFTLIPTSYLALQSSLPSSSFWCNSYAWLLAIFGKPMNFWRQELSQAWSYWFLFQPLATWLPQGANVSSNAATMIQTCASWVITDSCFRVQLESCHMAFADSIDFNWA